MDAPFIKDDEIIEEISGEDSCWFLRVGDSYNKIEATTDAAGNVWFNVYKNDKLAKRINGRFVEEIIYKIKEGE